MLLEHKGIDKHGAMLKEYVGEMEKGPILNHVDHPPVQTGPLCCLTLIQKAQQ